MFIKYVGIRAAKRDNIAYTGTVWYGKDDVQEVEDKAGTALLKHASVWQQVDATSAEAAIAEVKQAKAAEAQAKAEEAIRIAQEQARIAEEAEAKAKEAEAKKKAEEETKKAESLAKDDGKRSTEVTPDSKVGDIHWRAATRAVPDLDDERLVAWFNDETQGAKRNSVMTALTDEIEKRGISL